MQVELNNYLEILPGLFQSLKVNLATKLIMPLKVANLVAHLLQMYPVKWQWQYNLMENSNPLSTTALLLVLESIKSNVKVDEKPPCKDKAKVADSNQKMECTDSHNT